MKSSRALDDISLKHEKLCQGRGDENIRALDLSLTGIVARRFNLMQTPLVQATQALVALLDEFV